MSAFKDIQGQRFGRLYALRPMKSQKNQFVGCTGIRWYCLCVCGKSKIVHGIALRQGNTKSCGCLLIESRKKRGLILGEIYGGKYLKRWKNNERSILFLDTKNENLMQEWRVSYDISIVTSLIGDTCIPHTWGNVS